MNPTLLTLSLLLGFALVVVEMYLDNRKRR